MNMGHYYDDLTAMQIENSRAMRLAWNSANTQTINAISGIVFREIGNGNTQKAQILIDLIKELRPVLEYKE
jgi:hypothetical protein